jgi:hypothetical protein
MREKTQTYPFKTVYFMETFKNLCKLQLKKKRKEKKSSISKPIEKKKEASESIHQGSGISKKMEN